MDTISSNIKDYISIKLCDLTNDYIYKGRNNITKIDCETRELFENIISKLPKIKGVKIQMCVDSAYYANRNKFYKLQIDTENDIFIEMNLDKSKQSKEWLDERIKSASSDIKNQIDNAIKEYRKNFTILKRRLNRFMK